jgi:hypothetical protein
MTLSMATPDCCTRPTATAARSRSTLMPLVSTVWIAPRVPIMKKIVSATIAITP